MILIAACAGISGAAAQNNAQNSPVEGTFSRSPGTPAVSCPNAPRLKAENLHGRWNVRFDPVPAGLPATAVLELVRHPEFSESLSGRVIRALPVVLPPGTAPAAVAPQKQQHAAGAVLAGDLESGSLLLLDESSDNIRITGTWNAELVPSSCGSVFRGVWKDTLADSAEPVPEITVVISRPIAAAADVLPKAGTGNPAPLPLILPLPKP